MTTWTDDENGGTVWSEDEAAGTALGAANGASLVGFTQSGSAPTLNLGTTTVQGAIRELLGDRHDRIRAMLDAQRIRHNAGIPANIQVGRSLTAGYTGSPVAEGTLVIASSANASSASSSGTGTITDPFVISLKEIIQASGTTNFGFRWNDTAATYYIRLEDFNIAGWGTAQIEVNTATRLHLKRGTIGRGANVDATSTRLGIRLTQGDLICEQVQFNDCETSLFEIRHASSKATFIECQFDGGDRALRCGFALETNWQNVTVRAERCTFTCAATAVHMDYDSRVELVQCLFEDTVTRAMHAAYAAGLRELHRGPSGFAKYCRFEGTASEVPVHFQTAYEFQFLNCEFLDAPANKRVLYLEGHSSGLPRGIIPYNVLVHRCYFTRTTGTFSAGNELCESLDARDIRFVECWAEDAKEDAFEHVDGRGVCTVEYCVGDNCTGQIVDIFGEDTEGAYVHHIYGDTTDVGVLITDADGVIAHDIYTKNSASSLDSNWGNVTLEQRSVASGAGPNNCKIFGPLPLPASSVNSLPYKKKGTIGTGNEVVYWNGDALVTAESADTTNLVVR